jgi:hypothetical protein
MPEFQTDVFEPVGHILAVASCEQLQQTLEAFGRRTIRPVKLRELGCSRIEFHC